MQCTIIYYYKNCIARASDSIPNYIYYYINIINIIASPAPVEVTVMQIADEVSTLKNCPDARERAGPVFPPCVGIV